MHPISDIADFQFDMEPADPDRLIQVWLPEIEEAALTHVPDDRFISFLTAVLRLGAQSQNIKGFNLMDVITKAGYSRSTFFRLFEGYSSFLLRGYQLTCELSVKVYAQHLKTQKMDMHQFCNYTATVFFGANCCIPPEVIRMLWSEHNLTHAEFHPHLGLATSTIAEYLVRNNQTTHLATDPIELDGVIHNLDLDMLNARLDNNPAWGTPVYYNKLRRMLYGYLLTLT